MITPGVFHLPYVRGTACLSTSASGRDSFRSSSGISTVGTRSISSEPTPPGNRHKYMIIRGCPEIYEAGARLISAFTENEWQDAQSEQTAYLAVFLTTLAKFSGGRTNLSTETFRPGRPRADPHFPDTERIYDDHPSTLSRTNTGTRNPTSCRLIPPRERYDLHRDGEPAEGARGVPAHRFRDEMQRGGGEMRLLGCRVFRADVQKIHGHGARRVPAPRRPPRC